MESEVQNHRGLNITGITGRLQGRQYPALTYV